MLQQNEEALTRKALLMSLLFPVLCCTPLFYKVISTIATRLLWDLLEPCWWQEVSTKDQVVHSVGFKGSPREREVSGCVYVLIKLYLQYQSTG